jgi:hypothetical protein
MRWTILRPHWFMQNLLNEAGDISATGTFSLNMASARIGMIDAARASTADGDRGFDVVEGLLDTVGAGAESDVLAVGVVAVEVLDAAEPGGVDSGLEVIGPGRVGGGVAAGRAVGQGPSGGVPELNAQRDLRAGELVGQHRHGSDCVRSGRVRGTPCGD